MSKTHKTVTMYFQEGNSNKFYTASVVEDEAGTFSVPFTYGRRGTEGQSGVKVVGVSQAEAEKAYDKVVGEKKRKGYSE